MDPTARRIRRSPQQVRKILDAFRASGLTQTAFARQNGLSPGFLSRRLKKSQPKLAQETPHPVRFLEVDLPPLPGTSLYRILLPRDLTLEYSVPGGPVVYDFRMDGAGAGPKAFSEHYQGILQTDGYTAYDSVGGEGLQRACCLAHIRRRFFETLQVDPQNVHAGWVLLTIGKIYAGQVEKEAREAGLDAGERGRLRAQRSVELLGQLRGQVEQGSREALPKSVLGRACRYALNLWERLEVIF